MGEKTRNEPILETRRSAGMITCDGVIPDRHHATVCNNNSIKNIEILHLGRPNHASERKFARGHPTRHAKIESKHAWIDGNQKEGSWK